MVQREREARQLLKNKLLRELMSEYRDTKVRALLAHPVPETQYHAGARAAGELERWIIAKCEELTAE